MSFLFIDFSVCFLPSHSMSKKMSRCVIVTTEARVAYLDFCVDKVSLEQVLVLALRFRLSFIILPIIHIHSSANQDAQ